MEVRKAKALSRPVFSRDHQRTAKNENSRGGAGARLIYIEAIAKTVLRSPLLLG
jgi:hypothetical protein